MVFSNLPSYAPQIFMSLSAAVIKKNDNKVSIHTISTENESKERHLAKSHLPNNFPKNIHEFYS